MDDEEIANKARVKFSNFLRDRGAHAITVERIPGRGRRFAVVALFEEMPAKELPSSLKITTKEGEVDVPLIGRREERFQLE